MKKANLTENNFEVANVAKTLVDNGYTECPPDNYNQELFLDSEILLNFIKNTQPEEWEKLLEQYPANPEDVFFKRVSSEITKRGTLDVLRNGIKDRGAKFELAYFKPVSGLNPEHEKLYKQNKFTVIRQLPFSRKYQRTLDISIFLNGIPIITSELKNHFTGQDYTDAIKQYKYTREPKEPFLKRCFVHFAVDNDNAYFTTQLEGEITQFLPFNKDIENPDDRRGFKVAYLYHDIWHPDSLLEIISHYIQITENEDLKTGKKTKKMIFPCFHQLIAVKQLVDSARNLGTGKNYLIQHSAGSGKTFTISWLAHQLSQIHNQQDTRVFDNVIIISDRRVIDKQMKEAVNETDDIRKSFQPYYETTILSEGTDPNVLYEIERDILKFDIIDQSEIDRIAELWYSTEDQSKLHQVLSPAVERYKELSKEEKFTFKDNLRRYAKTYAFITQIVTFKDISLEKLYLYSRFFLKKLPIDKDSLPREIVESIDMDRYRIKATYKGGITLEKKEGQLTPLTPEEKQLPISEYDRLSAIIAKINEIGGTQFAEDDKVKFVRLGDKIYDNDHFKESMKTNTKSNLKLLFKKLFDEAMSDMYENDLNFYKKIEENPSVKELIKDNLFEDVFKRGREAQL